jgi:hypothetical protein
MNSLPSLSSKPKDISKVGIKSLKALGGAF